MYTKDHFQTVLHNTKLFSHIVVAKVAVPVKVTALFPEAAVIPGQAVGPQ